jgi:selenocysteine lyase/cysteine desulfurase
MLASQRALFDIPREVCFLTAASYSPLPLAALEAGRQAVARKGRPWLIDNAFAQSQYERTRKAAAAIISAEPQDIALISSVGYGVATAAKIVPVPPGSRVLVLRQDHSSIVLEWVTRAGGGAFIVENVQPPADHDWTNAVLAAATRPGAAPLAVVSISSVHWADGAMLDVATIARVIRAQGTVLLIDASQSAGVIDLNVRARDPDFVVFPTYKWLIGPYGRAFLYIAKRHQGGIPLEQTSHGRRAVNAEQEIYLSDVNYVDNARRFDMGERDHFISMEMAAIGMEMMAQWGCSAVAERLGALTTRLTEGLREAAVSFPERRVRAPHIVGLSFPDGMPSGLVGKLAAEKIHVTQRLGRPHVYNDEADIDRFIQAFLQLVRR